MSSTVASKTITELKVSAHLMTLEAGLFCVFNTPGAPPPDAITGLPGVRLSTAPASAGLKGSVSISAFNPSGWLGGDTGAALVRVVDGPAQVLVTVYQDPVGQHDAPKLQVIRLTEAAAGTAAGASAEASVQPSGPSAPAETARAPGKPRKIEVAAHIYGRGDVGGSLGEWMGEAGSKRWIEGFGLAPDGEIATTDIEYQAVLGRGWLSPWSEGGQFCGSRGMSLPILGMRVRLRGEAARTHALELSAVFVDGTEVGPVSDGEACEAPSLSPLEAFKVTVTLRPASKAGKTATKKAARRTAAAVSDEPVAAPTRGRGRTVGTAAAPDRTAPVAPPEPAPTKPAPRAGRKPASGATAQVAADVPPSPTPPKATAKPTPAVTRRR